MKFLYTAVLIIELAVLCICIIKAYKIDKQIAKSVRRIMQLGSVVVAVSMFLVNTSVIQRGRWEFTLYAVAVIWMFHFVLLFTTEYCGLDSGRIFRFRWSAGLAALDTLFLVINLFTGWMFDLESVIMPDKERYLRIVIRNGMLIHIGIVCFLAVLSITLLTIKYIFAPAIYHNRFLAVAVALFVITANNICFYIFHEAINVSTIFYAMAGMCIYYCALVYTPQKLLQRMLLYVEDDLSNALILIDADGNWVHMNKSADNLFSEVDLVTDEEKKTLRSWCRQRCRESKDNFEEKIVRIRHGKPMYLDVQFNRMTDKNLRLLGSFFMIRDYTEEALKIMEERYRTGHDELTGLYSKSRFYEKSMELIRRDVGRPHYMITTDVRNFKMVNDIFGQKTGDDVLVCIADILRKLADPAEMVFGRLGNDRFGLVMPKDLFEEEVFLENFRRIVHRENKQEYELIIHIGVYEITNINIPVDVMCDRAFMALETIKEDYQKRIAYYDEALRKDILWEQELTRDLRKAMKNEEIRIFLQPQIGVNGKVLGAEALVRWQHPKKGLLLPGEFVPMFEKNGMIAQLDRYVWEQACRQLRKWKDEGREGKYISVNISPKDFYFLDVSETFLELVEKYQINPRYLKLEITETSIMSNLQKQTELIEKLRKAGFVLEMDDFGSGYSSLNMLKDIKVDILKIDMAFLRKSENDSRGRVILQMVITMSKNLGMPVITEGVESIEQVEFLTEMGCDMFQGYYFAKPMPVSDFEERYMKQKAS